jgi:xanthine dehydrogenase accessory factor
MFEEYIRKVEEYRKGNEPFATAIVVRREAPSSGKAGDKAVINKYGEIFGWIGGGCTRSIILSEAERALKDGKPRLVRISPEADVATSSGVTAYRMTCHSGGTVDVFIEPILPKPHLVVLGKSAIARSLVRLAKAIDYRVTAVAPGAAVDTFERVDELHTRIDLKAVQSSTRTFFVVATQGEDDERALQEVLQTDRAYVAFVASRKKRDVIFDYLATAEGVTAERLRAVHCPAGIDIQAKLPEEVAISILAEIIQVLRTSAVEFTTFQRERAETDKPQLYVNPVCGIPVDPLTAKHVLEYEGEKVYFCCDGCKVSFEKDPAKYMESRKSEVI